MLNWYIWFNLFKQTTKSHQNRICSSLIFKLENHFWLHTCRINDCLPWIHICYCGWANHPPASFRCGVGVSPEAHTLYFHDVHPLWIVNKSLTFFKLSYASLIKRFNHVTSFPISCAKLMLCCKFVLCSMKYNGFLSIINQYKSIRKGCNLPTPTYSDHNHSHLVYDLWNIETIPYAVFFNWI